MKKLAVLAVALVATAGIGSMATGAPNDRVKVKTKLKATVTTTGFVPYRTVTVSGKVKAKKLRSLPASINRKAVRKKCKRGRKVRVKGLGKTKTNKKGRYSIKVGAPPPGTYEVKARRKKANAAGTKILCKKKKKNVTVP
jgi:hypothetical protein